MPNKNISNIKAKIRSWAKENNYKATISRDHLTITFSKERSFSDFFITCEIVSGTIFLDLSVLFKSTEFNNLFFDNYLPCLVEFYNCDSVIVAHRDNSALEYLSENHPFSNLKNSKNTKDISLYREIKNILDLEKDFIVYFLDENKFKKKFKNLNGIDNFLSSIQKEDALFQFKKKFFGKYSNGTKLSSTTDFVFYKSGELFAIEYIHEKEEPYFEISSLNNKVSLKNSILLFEVTNIEDFLNDTLKEIETKTNLTSLFDFPDDFYKDFINKHFSFLESHQKEILSILRDQYDPKDIEIYFSEKMKNCIPKSGIKNSIPKSNYISYKGSNFGEKFYLFKFLDVYFAFYNQAYDDDKYKLFHYRNELEASKKLKELIAENFSNSIDKELIGFRKQNIIYF